MLKTLKAKFEDHGLDLIGCAFSGTMVMVVAVVTMGWIGLLFGAIALTLVWLYAILVHHFQKAKLDKCETSTGESATS